jgi:SNF2 family DNA or RNA helicase
MFINLKNDHLVITSAYDPSIVLAIKKITGRSWNVKNKHWQVPKENVIEALDILTPLGFISSLPVKALAGEQSALMQLSEQIKKTPITPSPLSSPLPASDLPLYEFQKRGASFLSSIPNVLLADAPGLGKTLQTIVATTTSAYTSKLVLCPSSLKYNWEEEIKKWRPHDKVIVIDGDKEKRSAQWNVMGQWTVANYELLLHDYEQIKSRIMESGPFDVIICDEATRISNSLAKTTRALKSLPAARKIALTGTPISNSPIDIFSIFDWLHPRYLGNLMQFKLSYCSLDGYGNVIGYRNLDHLSKKIETFMLRRTKEEVLKDFPKKTTVDIPFRITDEEKEIYKNIQQEIWSELAGTNFNKQTLAIAPVKMLRLKQLTDHPALVGCSVTPSKFLVLSELVQRIVENEEKILVFTQFAEMAKILITKLEPFGALGIYGDIPAKERQIAVDRFNISPTCKVMVMTEAGAYGLNLQSASAVIHYDMPWSVAKLIQREDRAHRIGQTKPVTVYNLIAKDTIDEYVARVLHRKHKYSEDILQDYGRLEDAGLSEDDIKNILKI